MEKYLECVQVDPSYRKSLVEIVQLYYLLGRFEECADTVNSIADELPGNVRAIGLKAMALHELGDTNKSEEIFQDIIAFVHSDTHNGYDTMDLFWKGIALQFTGNLEQSIECFDTV